MTILYSGLLFWATL